MNKWDVEGVLITLTARTDLYKDGVDLNSDSDEISSCDSLEDEDHTAHPEHADADHVTCDTKSKILSFEVDEKCPHYESHK